MECQRRWKCPVKFRVRWLGYGEKDDTWLPASELSCDDLINEFLEISGRTSEYKVSSVVVKIAALTVLIQNVCLEYSKILVKNSVLV